MRTDEGIPENEVGMKIGFDYESIAHKSSFIALEQFCVLMYSDCDGSYTDLYLR